MTRATGCTLAAGVAILLCLMATTLPAAEKKSSDVMSSLQRDQALQMLSDVHDKVYKEYYDPTFHGVDFESRYREAVQKIHKAETVSDALGIIAWMLDGLNDSHTFFCRLRGLIWSKKDGKHPSSGRTVLSLR